MKREQLLARLSAVAQSSVNLLRRCPIEDLEFRPGPETRSLLELGDHFAATPLVDLATVQGSPAEVVATIEETLHGAGPVDWVPMFDRGIRAAVEYFEGLGEEEFETRESRAHYGTSRTQAEWLLELVTHVYHHRAQLYLYLRMLRVTVGVEQLYV